MASLENLIKRTRRLSLHDKVTRRVLADITVQIEVRIFEKGLDSNNNLIGVYSIGYQKTRQREGYPISKKVILQARGDMRSDWTFLVLPGGNYGSGFNRSGEYGKSLLVEHIYDKKIFSLSQNEDKEIEINLDKELTKFLSKL